MRTIVLTMLAASMILVGCGTTGNMKTQLERVAKDWCLVVRAGRVIPVFPLTSDLQPGDVFLVKQRIEEQVAEYESKGFMAFEQHVARLNPTNYLAFYSGADDAAFRVRLRSVSGDTNANHWESFPHAAFPSYTFSVSREAGAITAFPVQGIPLGLTLLGSGRAHGSVTISDSYTYGIDLQSLDQQVQEWAKDLNAKKILRDNGFYFQRGPHLITWERSAYLRVVSRVYLAQALKISIASDEASDGVLSGGAANQLELSNLSTNYSSSLGGTLKVTARSSRSVSIDEKFPQPLVIGYHGFDYPILPGGKLGSPRPIFYSSHSQLYRHYPLLFLIQHWLKDRNARLIADWIKVKHPVSGNYVNKNNLRHWLNEKGCGDVSIDEILLFAQRNDIYEELRAEIVHQFQLRSLKDLE